MVADDLDYDPSRPRSPELAEQDALPGAQAQTAAGDGHANGVADEGGLEVSHGMHITVFVTFLGKYPVQGLSLIHI